MSNVPPIGAPDEPAAKQRGSMAQRLTGPKAIAAAVIAALAVWFILANTSHTRIHFWVVWVTAQLWIVLAGTFLAGLVLGFLLRRGRERKRRD